jgi:hypothetical protein
MRASLSALFFVIALGHGAVVYADASAPTLAQAQNLLQAGKADEAHAMFAAVLAREPENITALDAVVRGLRAQNKLDQALELLQRKQQLRQGHLFEAQVHYELGVLYAQRGEADAAFGEFAKAKDSRRVDLSALTQETALAALREDPRYTALLPKAEDFADPFVEPVKIVHEWRGEASGDQFGWIARDLGDVDGDGAHDLVTSAPTHDGGGADAGRVYVYSGRSGKLIWQADGVAGDQLGTGLERAGDVNADGIADVVAGGPNGAAGGVVVLYSGKDGKELRRFTAEHAGDQFGAHTEGVGDANADGHADVIIGAPFNAAAGTASGRAYLYSGRDGTLLRRYDGKRAGERLGSAVSGYADGAHTLILVGAPGGGASGKGRVDAYTGLSGKPKWTWQADASGGAFGAMFIAVPGDVDGDGAPDVYVSDWANNAGHAGAGRAYVFSGKTGKRVHQFTGEHEREGLGTTQGVAGDVDFDGHADLIVGSWQYAGAAISGGRAQLFSGKTGERLKTYTCRTPGDTFGFDAVGMGDVDGDGTVDLLITSGWSAVSGFQSGRVFLISSGLAPRVYD